MLGFGDGFGFWRERDLPSERKSEPLCEESPRKCRLSTTEVVELDPQFSRKLS